ncbi:uncharacterized protein LOC121508476 [Cheilinus undulatus]|uniref:uncharacterized protein LOC121508476 n=1 Tax=Cheilinus undulatus TaxID=241271 RepID=UPI001BD36383|nr:uncharacterized protein LOC121508476 [Cheilinus undulatus]
MTAATPLDALSTSHVLRQCEQAKDGTLWEVIQPGAQSGRAQSQNVLTESAGPTAHAKRNVEDAVSTFLCLDDRRMLHHIRDCTVAEARSVEERWDLSVAELKASISLLYLRGAYSKNLEMESLWSEDWGLPFFRTTMPRSRFREIMRYLRFDKKSDRCARLCTDKFALFSDVWSGFIDNCIACYKPGAYITVDEQLFPTKARCRFIQYMANKPNKFGIKFWLAADVDTKYLLNGFPYLGKDEARPAHQRLGESVVLRLLEPYQQREELFSTKVLKHDHATLTVYQGKPRKNVALLSTMHPSVTTGGDK